MSQTAKGGKKEGVQNNRIAYYREREGMNQGEFGKNIGGLSQQSISAFENGAFYPRSNDIILMLKLFQNVTFDELFNTDRLSVYIADYNNQLLEKYMKDLDDVHSVRQYTEYERKSIMINHILRFFLESQDESFKKYLLNNLRNKGQF